MARSKRTVKKRAKIHRVRVHAGIKMRARRRSRGYSPASVKRKRRADRKQARVK